MSVSQRTPELPGMKEQCMLQQVLNSFVKSQLEEMDGNQEISARPLMTSLDGNGFMSFELIK